MPNKGPFVSTDGMDKPKTICPFNFSKVRGIITACSTSVDFSDDHAKQIGYYRDKMERTRSCIHYTNRI